MVKAESFDGVTEGVYMKNEISTEQIDFLFGKILRTLPIRAIYGIRERPKKPLYPLFL